MEFAVACDVLVEAVSWTARALPVRLATPVLAGVHTQAEAGELILPSFDYEVFANSHILAAIEEAGEILVSDRSLADISKPLLSKSVTIKLDGQRVELACGSSHFTLTAVPLDEYLLLSVQPQTVDTVGSQVLSQAISQVSIAISRDDTLPLLIGVRMKIDGEHMILLMTDRYRFAMRELEWTPVDPAFEHIVLVKVRILQDVAKSMTLGETVELGISNSSQQGVSSLTGFEASGHRTTSILMDNDYPLVRRLFLESTPIRTVCDRHTLLEVVRRMPLVAEQKISVRLSLTDGSLVLEVGQGDNV